MIIEGLKPLYYDMRSQKQDRDKFKFSYNNVKFDAIFLIDRQPFELLMGVIGSQFACTLLVQRGFIIEMPNEIFYELREILNLQAGKGKFNSPMFLKYLSDHCPSHASQNSVQPHELAPHKQSLIKKEDDPNKIYFCGWNDHQKDGRKARNFDKTKLLMNKVIADYCRANNISTMWSSNRSEMVEYHNPAGFQGYR